MESIKEWGIHHKRNTVSFNGTENWKYDSTYNRWHIAALVLYNSVVGAGKAELQCNYFKYSNSTQDLNKISDASSSDWYFYIEDKYLNGKNIDSTNLYTCDIICHGVPSPGIYKEYLNKLEEKFSSKIKSINFRYKENEYTQNIKIEFENGKQYISNYFKGDELYNLFLKDYILRDSCYRCNYASTKRVSDITIGDFWGIEKTIKNFDDKKGVSLVLINTEKGKAIFDKVSDKFNLIESNIEDCMQNNLRKPCDIPPKYDELWNIYRKNGYNCMVNFMKNL